MTETQITPRPLNSAENALRQKYAEAYAAQSDLMDKLAQQLITLELAVPGLYASVLTLTYGKGATLRRNWWLVVIFGCWFAALMLALASIFPRKWTVDPDLLDGDVLGRPGAGGALSIKEFFAKSAIYKRNLLFWSAFLLGVGIFGAALIVIL